MKGTPNCILVLRFSRMQDQCKINRLKASLESVLSLVSFEAIKRLKAFYQKRFIFILENAKSICLLNNFRLISHAIGFITNPIGKEYDKILSLLSSSAVEQVTVNHLVAGSIPA